MANVPGPEPAEYDVFICCANESGAEMASTISAYLTRAGFRVFLEDRPQSGGSLDGRLELIDEIPDFVFLSTPVSLAALSDSSHPVHREVARALATGRNIVRVARADAPGAAVDVPPDLAALGGQQALTYDPDRLAESLAILRHSLSSDTTASDRRLMRGAKRWFLFAALFALVGVSLQIVPPLIKAWTRPRPLPPVAPLTLYWASFGQRQSNGSWAEFPLAQGTRVSGGDQIRVAFSPSADGFAYVIARDSQGRVSVLFPAETVKGASRVRAGRVYGAPIESAWMTIDEQTGLEAICVFASYDPLQNLEELVEEQETPTSIGARRQLVDQTIAGLLDGRHYQLGRRLWIRTMQFVDQELEPAAGPRTFSTELGSGEVATHASTVQHGLVSALGEVAVAFAGRQAATGGR